MTIAGNDPLRMERVWRETRVRDGLECYVRALKERAEQGFMHEQLLFVNGGMKKAPKKPEILRRQRQHKRKDTEFKEPEKPAFLDALEKME